MSPHAESPLEACGSFGARPGCLSMRPASPAVEAADSARLSECYSAYLDENGTLPLGVR